MNITVSFECKKYIDKQDNIALTLRITINRKNDYLGIGRKIPASAFSFKTQKVKTSYWNYESVIKYIEEAKVNVWKIIDQLHKTNEGAIDFPMIKYHYDLDTGKSSNCFFTFVENEINEQTKKGKNSLSEGTIQTYLNSLRVIKAYQGRLEIFQITPRWLDRFFHSSENEYENSTLILYRDFFVKYLRLAVKRGFLRLNPMDSIEYAFGDRNEVEYLTTEELISIQEAYTNQAAFQDETLGTRRQKSVHKMMWMFLYSCYSGLRLGDIETIAPEHIVDGKIRKIMDKGSDNQGKLLNIPISKPLLDLVPYEEASPTSVFGKPLSRSTISTSLIEVARIVGIEKHLHFHMARHTFAVQSLTLGMDMKVLSELLGHSSVMTTERYYAKIVDELRENSMKIWDTFGKLNTIEKVHCHSCGIKVFEYPKGSILFSQLHIKCHSCETQFQISEKEDSGLQKTPLKVA